MGRKSILTPDQWIEVERRHVVDGESINSLAKEFKIDESAIRRKIKPNKSECPNRLNPLKELALKKVKVDSEAREISDQIASLPYAKQRIVESLSRKLINISTHLASAAERGAMTADHLSGIAHMEAAKVDPTKLEQSVETLKGVALLTRMANDASEIPLNLLNANKERMKGLDSVPPETGPLPSDPVEAAKVYQQLVAGG